jgi:hypothetical protein
MGCDLEAVHLEPECAACLFSAWFNKLRIDHKYDLVK